MADQNLELRRVEPEYLLQHDQVGVVPGRLRMSSDT
jgi:hypothetical protein